MQRRDRVNIAQPFPSRASVVVWRGATPRSSVPG